MIDQQVPGQPGKPDNKQSFARPEAFQVLEHAQEDVLREVLRFLVAAGKPIANRIDTPGMHPYQVFPSGLLAIQAGSSPRLIQTRLQSYLSTADRNAGARPSKEAA